MLRWTECIHFIRPTITVSDASAIAFAIAFAVVRQFQHCWLNFNVSIYSHKLITLRHYLWKSKLQSWNWTAEKPFRSHPFSCARDSCVVKMIRVVMRCAHCKSSEFPFLLNQSSASWACFFLLSISLILLWLNNYSVDAGRKSRCQPISGAYCSLSRSRSGRNCFPFPRN